MEAEETYIEHAPVTPAHKFAWRAFKGFVYGSPESPENMGKENAYPVRMSPQKRVSLEVPSLSPQKRKRDPQISPTKSILRTPGAPTPRAKSLRDVNVKFKSISPEVQARNVSAPAATIVAIEQQVDNLWQELEHSLNVAKSPPQTKRAQPEQKAAKLSKTKAGFVVSAAAAPPPPDEEREAYARRTEKEVKQLLRQHKRLRDYAQRADEQNVVLQGMVDELRAENARLKTRLERQDRELKDVSRRPALGGDARSDERERGGRQAAKPASGAPKPVKDSKATAGLSRTEAFKRSLRGEDPGPDVPASNTANHGDLTRDPPHSKRHVTAVSGEQQSFDSQPAMKPQKGVENNNNRPSTAAPNPSAIRQRASTTPEAPPQAPNPPKFHKEPPSDPQTQHHDKTSPLSLTALAAQLEPTPAQPRGLVKASPRVTSLQNSTASQPGNRVSSLPADRAAAARLRLARRKEEKAMGNATSLAFAGGEMEASRVLGGRGGSLGRSAGGGGGEGREEESAVDWAGL